MNVDSLDLPKGVGSAYNRKKTALLDVTSINEIEEVNKDSFINNWLQTNNVGEVDVDNHIVRRLSQQEIDSKQLKTELKTTKIVKPRNSEIVSEHSSRSNTNSSQSKRLEKDSDNINILPAGCKFLSGSSRKSNTSSKISKNSNTLIPNVNNIVSKVDKIQIEEKSSREMAKFTADETLDPSWSTIFNKQEAVWSNSGGEDHQKIQKHMKRAVGLCTCAKCEREVPTDLVHDTVNFEIPKGPVEHKRPPPLLKLEDYLLPNIMTTPVLKNAYESNTLPLLTHGHTVPHPQYEINRTNLISKVQKRLTDVGYERCKPVQSYGWPGIMRGNNVVIINAHETGKTLTYVAPLCSFLLDDDGMSDPITDKSHGPILIIVANSSHIAEQVHVMFASFMRNDKFAERVWLAILPLSQKQIIYRYKKSQQKTDIIITTPDTLIALLNERVIDLKRLRYIVFENVDIILDKMQNNFNMLIDAIDSMLRNRNSYIGVQFISTGERWTKKLEQFVVKLDNFPLIIIGNPMQAALYGRADIHLQYLQQKLKPEKLTEILKTSNYQLYKCIVVCKLDEVTAIEKQFASKGITFVTTTDLMNRDEVMDLQISWKTTPNGKNMVLIATDKALRSYIKLSNASFLINYSLPPTWTLFFQRFGTLMDSYLCPLTSSFNGNKFNCKIVTYVDEKSVDRFPRIFNFYNTNGIKIPEELQEYCKQQKTRLELEKIQENIKLCKCLLLFGECHVNNCPDRHVFSKSIEGIPKIPSNGQITCRYVNMKQPNQYMLQILQYKDLNGEIHYLEDYGNQVDSLLSEYTGFEQCTNIVKGGRYIYCNRKHMYRCSVIRIAKYASIGSTTTTEPLEVEIYGLDNGLKLLANVDKLFVMSEQLQRIPQSIVEVIVGSIIPPFKQSMWTKNLHQDLLSELDSFNNDSFAIANMVLRLNNTIWVDDMQLKKVEGPFTKWFVLSKYLKQKKLYELSEGSLGKLYKLCKEAEIILPDYKVVNILAKQPVFEQKPGNCAYLSDDELNLVFFSTATSSNSVYVKLAKYDDLLKKLEKDIGESSKAIMRKLQEDEILVGCYYAIVDPACGGCCRVLLTGIDDNYIATCFYVDYGDHTTIPVANLKFLNDDFITRLPFQAIECSLYGLMECNNGQFLDVLYDYTLTPLCAKYISEETLGKTKRYKILLIDYTEEPICINQVLIDKEIAEKFIDEKLEDIEIPVCKELNGTHSEEEPEDWDKKLEAVANIPDEFELVHDKMGEMNSSTAKKSNIASDISKNKNEYLPMKAVASSDKIPPQIIWYQTEKEVFVQFMFLENNDYKITVNRNRFLNFSSKYQGKSYSVIINLFESVSKNILHESKTHFILLTLTKEKEQEWPRFAKSEERQGHIKYKIEKIEEESSDSDDLRAEDDPRFFEHIEVSNDGVVHEFYSDLEDSESDYHSDDWE